MGFNTPSGGGGSSGGGGGLVEFIESGSLLLDSTTEQIVDVPNANDPTAHYQRTVSLPDGGVNLGSWTSIVEHESAKAERIEIEARWPANAANLKLICNGTQIPELRVGWAVWRFNTP